MLFCDFSPHPDRVADFARVGTIVLDHHRTAKRIVEAMGDYGVFGDESAEPGISGAVLAHRHVWLVAAPLDEEHSGPMRALSERFARLVGVRDTWQRTSPLWADACALSQMLLLRPKAWWHGVGFEDLEGMLFENLLEDGRLLQAKEEERVRRAIDGGYRFTTADGRRVLAVQGVSVTSDGAELLGASVDLLVGFSYVVEDGAQKMKLSLRSHTGVDCAAIAKALGGGGHTAAAGCSLRIGADDRNPFAFIEKLIAPRDR
jgi:DHHA1 domain